MKRILAITCAGALVLALASCSSGQSGSGSYDPTGGSSSSVSSSASGSGADMSGAGSSAASSSTQDSQGATLYIGMNGEFKEYPVESKEEITPESLIAAMAELTGWNLDVVSAVEGNGKVAVAFAETSALYVGAPEEQKEEFQVKDAGQLDQMILDSIQKTIQVWIGGEDGAAEVYFTAADGSDLVLEGIGVTISADSPYTGFPTTAA